MTRKEFVEKLLSKSGMTEKVSKSNMEHIFNTTFELIKEVVKKEEKFTVSRFGTFKLRKRTARKGRNPRTGEVVKIKASKTIAFKASTTLKDQMK